LHGPDEGGAGKTLDKEELKMIKIRSKKAGFRRCGIAHPKEAVQYPDDRFSEEELAILQAEPMLVVEIVKEQEEKAADADASPATEADETGKESAKTGKKGKR
jgi:hypothetical protein